MDTDKDGIFLRELRQLTLIIFHRIEFVKIRVKGFGLRFSRLLAAMNFCPSRFAGSASSAVSAVNLPGVPGQ
jgi:hypothetical protein